MSTAAPDNIDQSEDFMAFTLDGKTIEFDLFEATTAMADIDRKHKGDLHTCNACGLQFALSADDDQVKCPGPECGSADIRFDQSFLDDVAAYLIARGYPRCGRRAAGLFYQRTVDIRTGLKKNTVLTPESATGLESTAPAGLTVAGELS